MPRIGRLPVATLVTAVMVLGAVPARAGGPMAYDSNGLAVGWSTAAPVPFSIDQGGLGLLTHAQADSLVSALFGTWEAVPTATISYQKAADLPVDVDDTNFGPYLGPSGGNTTPLGKNAIVFDSDGAIFDLLYGVGTGVIGFAGPTYEADGSGTHPIMNPGAPGSRVVEGVAVLNGQFIDGIDAYPNGEMSLDRFKAVFVHEFGHFSGLGHTQIHGLIGPAGTKNGGTHPRETMFPFLDSTPVQLTLERDDIVAISSIYPTPDFAANTFAITGRVLTSDGTPLSGINVVARNVNNDADAVSYVTGAMLTPAGVYFLKGLTPGQLYRVDVREVESQFRGGSKVGPFTTPVIMAGPPESWNGAAESADLSIDPPSDYVTITGTAGATVAGIDITVNRQLFSVDNSSLGNGSFVGFAVADFDHDGTTDLITTQQGTNPGNLTRYRHGLGGGTFGPATTIATFAGNSTVASGQFNASVDDHRDIVVSSDGPKEIRVYFGNGGGSFGAPQTLFTSSCTAADCFTGVRVADLNGDGRDDIVAAVRENDGSTTVKAWLATGTGSFTLVQTVFTPAQNVWLADLCTGDFAGSPAPDVIGLNPQTPELELLVGDGAGGFTLVRKSLLAWSHMPERYLTAGDFDEDGRQDVAYTSFAPIISGVNDWSPTNCWVTVLHGNGAGDFSFSTRVMIPEPGRAAISAADFDQDDHLDIVTTAYGAMDPGSKVVIAFGDGTGGIRRVESVWGLAENNWSVAVGDLNGDPYPDLLVGHSDDRKASLLLNRLGTLVGVPRPDLSPVTGTMLRSAPNPFDASTTLHYELSTGADVDVAIYDVRGARVRTLAHRHELAGPHEIAWNGEEDSGTRARPGVYFARVSRLGNTLTRRIIKLQ